MHLSLPPHETISLLFLDSLNKGSGNGKGKGTGRGKEEREESDSGLQKLEGTSNSSSALSARETSDVQGERNIMVDEMIVEGTCNMNKTNIIRIWVTERSHSIILCMLRQNVTLLPLLIRLFILCDFSVFVVYDS